MNKLFYILFVSAVLLFACESEVDEKAIAQQNAEIKLVKETFSKYKTAVLSQKGYDAVTCLNQKTIDYYDDILNEIQFATKEEINNMSGADQMQVIAIRHLFSKEDIFSLTGLTLYASTITDGLMKGDNLKTMGIGQVAIKGKRAKAQMVKDGVKTPIFFDFSKEEGQWKIDVTTTLIMTSKHLDAQANEAGLSRLDFLFNMLQMTEEEKVEIFEPLKVQ